MTPKSNALYVEHMLDCISRINHYVENKEQFYESSLVQDAVARNLQTMAESSQRLADDIKIKYPEIPWRSISGFRNILVHDYLGLDIDTLWSVVEQELPKLDKVLQEISAHLI